jgi:hypothetical protein
MDVESCSTNEDSFNDANFWNVKLTLNDDIFKDL